MTFLTELIVSGLAIGAIYGLIAMSFAVIYKATGLVNFAQGEVAMIVAYVAWTISVHVDGNPFVVAAAAIVFAGLFGLAIERLVIRPMMGEPVFTTIMVTIGLAVVLRSSIVFLWDAYPHALDLGVGQEILEVGGVRLRSGQVAVFLILIAVIVGFFIFFRRSRFGVAMRAVASDDRTALLMGVSTARVQSVAWAVATIISGIAGVMFAIIYELSPVMFTLGLKAFPATILGGLDSVLGTAFGGLVIGTAENLVGGYFDPRMKEVAGFIIIILILMVRPFGLFGTRRIERV
ncbi:branched-chain amino acid ABC transporter permease [Rhodoligotrophos defluvii]|uniref:branched-chain amino acid ABC transporter permease n=1 Tax=Rhodoligotrophos defluvii TaxID=2561934 RepID=UPI0010C94F58|nr:branched-chain amino acid ABC transporter permease [Rhodoligotrophos defluvii]